MTTSVAVTGTAVVSVTAVVERTVESTAVDTVKVTVVAGADAVMVVGGNAGAAAGGGVLVQDGAGGRRVVRDSGEEDGRGSAGRLAALNVDVGAGVSDRGLRRGGADDGREGGDQAGLGHRRRDRLGRVDGLGRGRRGLAHRQELGLDLRRVLLHRRADRLVHGAVQEGFVSQLRYILPT
ncbi:hypothetical protein PG997_015423 [Apiospora hydei]|uniref:Uncharacterized protein n=1 Tax=Apiospora hydei TaxID=1337664 RepID=A0ABR1UQK9_9PEZI